jgi:hypothetical protein
LVALVFCFGMGPVLCLGQRQKKKIAKAARAALGGTSNWQNEKSAVTTAADAKNLDRGTTSEKTDVRCNYFCGRTHGGSCDDSRNDLLQLEDAPPAMRDVSRQPYDKCDDGNDSDSDSDSESCSSSSEHGAGERALAQVEELKTTLGSLAEVVFSRVKDITDVLRERMREMADAICRFDGRVSALQDAHFIEDLGDGAMIYLFAWLRLSRSWAIYTSSLRLPSM